MLSSQEIINHSRSMLHEIKLDIEKLNAEIKYKKGLIKLHESIIDSYDEISDNSIEDN